MPSGLCVIVFHIRSAEPVQSRHCFVRIQSRVLEAGISEPC